MRECQLCKHCFTDDVATCPNDGMPTAHTIDGPPVLEGKYHLDLRLGQGGMGVVYKARHAYLKTLHAIKIILPDLVGNDPQLVTRFRQEALAAAAIRHQNVVNTTDYGVINGNIPFLVMEYVEGESLHDLLTREKRLDPERAFDLISAICAGVGAAHHQGIVHRDLKPLNVMICKDKPSISQAVKILDFGLAKIKSGELLGSFIQAQTTGLMGSPYYMAPEQWSDDEPDSRSDIYSLGVMLFQMLSGDVPFKGSSIPAIMKKHISDPPPAFFELGVSVSPELELAVRHTLQKEPEKRTTTVEMMIDVGGIEGERLCEPGSVAPEDDYPAGWLTRLRRGIVSGVAVTGLAVLVAAIPTLIAWLAPGADTTSALSALRQHRWWWSPAIMAAWCWNGTFVSMTPLLVTIVLGWLVANHAQRCDQTSGFVGYCLGYTAAMSFFAGWSRLGATHAPILRALSRLCASSPL